MVARIETYNGQPKLEIGDVIGVMPEGGTISLSFPDQENCLARKEVLVDVAARLNQDMSQISLVSLLERPGASLYMHKLEHTYFAPFTPMEPLLKFSFVRWCDTIWSLVTIPSKYVLTYFHTAAKTNMRVVRGSPTVIDSSGEHRFPLTRTFMLENVPGMSPLHDDAARLMVKLISGELTPEQFDRNMKAAKLRLWRKEVREINEFCNEIGIEDI